MSGMCNGCRHWDRKGAEATRGDDGKTLQALCRSNPKLASPPLMWSWEGCRKFEPELMPYPHGSDDAAA